MYLIWSLRVCLGTNGNIELIHALSREKRGNSRWVRWAHSMQCAAAKSAAAAGSPGIPDSGDGTATGLPCGSAG